MRLIDADEFDATLRDGEVRALKMHNTKQSSVIQMIRGNLRKAPTIEERKTGRWIHERVNSEHSVTGYFLLSSCECSECGVFCEQESKFCPFCGADMRKAKFDEKRGNHEQNS